MLVLSERPHNDSSKHCHSRQHTRQQSALWHDKHLETSACIIFIHTYMVLLPIWLKLLQGTECQPGHQQGPPVLHGCCKQLLLQAGQTLVKALDNTDCFKLTWNKAGISKVYGAAEQYRSSRTDDSRTAAALSACWT
jgi:hypothetical protein